jgi:hypothetical protein
MTKEVFVVVPYNSSMDDTYPIGGGFTEGELKFASFWVRHRIVLRQIGLGTLITLNALLWGYSLWGLLDAYAISYPRESRITSEIAENQFIAAQLQGNRPENIQTGSVLVFASANGRMDMVLPIKNPNTVWWVEFDYRFNVSGERTPVRRGFLLPMGSSYIGEFGFKPATAGARTANLEVDNIRWHRLDPAQVGDDYSAWVSRRNALATENVEFRTDVAIGAQKLGQSSFTFVNNTAYGFWNVQLYVLLKRVNTIVAATAITMERVQPGERRPVRITWTDRTPASAELEVVPVVNLLDPAAYLPSTKTGE